MMTQVASRPSKSYEYLSFFFPPRMRSEGFLFLSGGLGAGSCLTRFRHVCAERSRASASVRKRPRHVRLGVAIGSCNSACLERACVWTLRVAGVGDRGSTCAALDRGLAFCVASVGLRMDVGVWEDAGRWIRLAGEVNRAF